MDLFGAYLLKMEKIIGIYKITNPKNNVYIGQSIDIKKRWHSYSKLWDCKGQIALYRSFLKYGVQKHKFEILAVCNKNELNDQERYYQDLYSAIGKNGLNCLLTNTVERKREWSDETKEKHRESIRKSRIGKKHSPETIAKFSLKRKGFKVSDETKAKISKYRTGLICSDETKKNMSIAQKKRCKGMGNERLAFSLRKYILDLNTGVYYHGVKDAAMYNNINANTLKGILNGNNKNTLKINLIYA